MELSKNYHKLGEQTDSVFQVSFRVKPEKDSLQSSKNCICKISSIGGKNKYVGATSEYPATHLHVIE